MSTFNKTTKKIHLIIQGKGHPGKTTLTRLLALKFDSEGIFKKAQLQKNKNKINPILFVDLESKLHSLSSPSSFLKGQDPIVLMSASIYNENHHLIRDKILYHIKYLADLNYENIYIDFGQAESNELKYLLRMDLSIQELKKFTDNLQINLVFDIVVGGGSNFENYIQYTNEIIELNNAEFECNIWVNEFRFYSFPNIIHEFKKFASSENAKKPQRINHLKTFGGFEFGLEVSNRIISGIGSGIDYNTFYFLEKLRLDKEFKKMELSLLHS